MYVYIYRLRYRLIESLCMRGCAFACTGRWRETEIHLCAAVALICRWVS